MFPLVYNELRKVAHRYLRNERPDHTLQSTALVHEAYLRLEKQGGRRVQESRALRRNLCATDAADSGGVCAQPQSPKRDGGFRLSLSDGVPGKTPSVDMIALDDALSELAKLDRQQSKHCGAEILRRPFHRGDFACAQSFPHHREAALGHGPALAASRDEQRTEPMKPERWQQIREVLEGALELAPGERSAFLERPARPIQLLAPGS